MTTIEINVAMFALMLVLSGMGVILLVILGMAGISIWAEERGGKEAGRIEVGSELKRQADSLESEFPLVAEYVRYVGKSLEGGADVPPANFIKRLLRSKLEKSRGYDIPPPENLQIRPVIHWFAVEMERKLRANDGRKGDWRNVQTNELLDGLRSELRELVNMAYTGRVEDIVSECADVANYAMMIADRAMRRKTKEEI